MVDANETRFIAASTEVFVFLDRDAQCTRVEIGGAAAPAIDFERWQGRSIRDCFADAGGRLMHTLEQARSASVVHRIEGLVSASTGGAARLFEVTIAPTPAADGWMLALRDVTASTEARKLEA